MSAPDSAWIALMFLPPGPISSPILSGLILVFSMRGAYWLSGFASLMEIFLGRHHRFDRALSERAVADLAAVLSAEAAGLTHAERWKVVVQDEALRVCAAGIRVHLLRFIERRERGESHSLRFTAREERRT